LRYAGVGVGVRVCVFVFVGAGEWRAITHTRTYFLQSVYATFF